MPTEERHEETRVLFAALSDRARLKILHALSDAEELCVCDVAHVVGTTVSTASHHLRKLRDLKTPEVSQRRKDGLLLASRWLSGKAARRGAQEGRDLRPWTRR